MRRIDVTQHVQNVSVLWTRQWFEARDTKTGRRAGGSTAAEAIGRIVLAEMQELSDQGRHDEPLCYDEINIVRATQTSNSV